MIKKICKFLFCFWAIMSIYFGNFFILCLILNFGFNILNVKLNCLWLDLSAFVLTILLLFLSDRKYID